MKEERLQNAVMKIVSEDRRPVCRPKKRRIDGLEEDLTRLGAWRWRELKGLSCFMAQSPEPEA